MTVTPLLAFAGVVIGALGAYLAAARKLSGKISTTDAGKLWDASETMRREMVEELTVLRKRVRELEGDNSNLQRSLLGAERQIAELSHRVEGVENGGR